MKLPAMPAPRPIQRRLGSRATDTSGWERVPVISTGFARLTRLARFGLGARNTSNSSVSRSSIPLPAMVTRRVSSRVSSIFARPSFNSMCATIQFISVSGSLCHRGDSKVGIRSDAQRSNLRPVILPGPEMMVMRPSAFPRKLRRVAPGPDRLTKRSRRPSMRSLFSIIL